MHHWLIVASPFLLAFAILGVIKGWAAYDKWRAERVRRIRNENMRKYGFAPFKDRWLL
jgi:hypothetical protein